ncbi:MAG: hypothetical protein OER56_01195 [Hyphomicrobiales bacterium]|nr:hypothetical protein [Hyphomicrobiales bacterium]
MKFKRALTVLLTAFWVLSQSVMVFAHSSVAEPLAGDVTTTGTDAAQSANADCLAHSSDAGAGHANDANAPPHDHGIADVCCNAVCSVVAKFSVFLLGSDDVARLYDPTRIATPKVALLGLPTPPPDTTI